MFPDSFLWKLYRNRLKPVNTAVKAAPVEKTGPNKYVVWIVRRKSTGKFEFPGGSAKVGEDHKDTLSRELKEEARIVNFEVLNLLYYSLHDECSDPHRKFFYAISDFEVDKKLPFQDSKMEPPIRIPLEDLSPYEMPKAHGKVLELLQKKLLSTTTSSAS